MAALMEAGKTTKDAYSPTTRDHLFARYFVSFSQLNAGDHGNGQSLPMLIDGWNPEKMDKTLAQIIEEQC